MFRVFRDGHNIEGAVIEDLRLAGFEIASHGADGKQFKMVFTLPDVPDRKVTGKVDGIVTAAPAIPELVVPAVLEVKSFNRAAFEKLAASGVRAVKPNYYRQLMIYLGYSGYKHGLFVGYCKDDASYHCEIVEADPVEIRKVFERVERLISFGVPEDLPREGMSESAPPCSWCRHRERCWGSEGFAKLVASKAPIWAL